MVTAIDGVRIKNLKVVPDERGWLMEILRCNDELFEKFAHLAMHPLAREIFLPGESEDHAGAGLSSAGGKHTSCFVEPDGPLATRYAKQGLAVHPAFTGNPVAGFAAGIDRMGEHASQTLISRSGNGGWMVHGCLLASALMRFAGISRSIPCRKMKRTYMEHLV